MNSSDLLKLLKQCFPCAVVLWQCDCRGWEVGVYLIEGQRRTSKVFFGNFVEEWERSREWEPKLHIHHIKLKWSIARGFTLWKKINNITKSKSNRTYWFVCFNSFRLIETFVFRRNLCFFQDFPPPRVIWWCLFKFITHTNTCTPSYKAECTENPLIVSSQKKNNLMTIFSIIKFEVVTKRVHMNSLRSISYPNWD